MIDDCHHATGNHPYSRIMEQHYHPAKRAGLPVPKVLGLSASLVIKSVRLDQFRAEKAALERSLDAVVETAAELSLAQFVSSAKERMVHFPPSAPTSLRASVTPVRNNAFVPGKPKIDQKCLGNIDSRNVFFCILQL